MPTEDELIKIIRKLKPFSTPYTINKMVKEEIATMKGLINEETALFIIAKKLGWNEFEHSRKNKVKKMTEKKYKTKEDNEKDNRSLKFNGETVFMIMVVLKPKATKMVDFGDGEKEVLDGQYIVYNPADKLIAFIWKNKINPSWIEQRKYTLLTWDDFKDGPTAYQWIVPDPPKTDRNGQPYPTFEEDYETHLKDNIQLITKDSVDDAPVCKALLKDVLKFIDELSDDDKLMALMKKYYTAEVAGMFEKAYDVVK